MDKYIASLIFLMQSITNINNLILHNDNQDFPNQCIYLEEVQDVGSIESFNTYTSDFNLIFKIFDTSTSAANEKVKKIIEDVYSKRLYIDLIDQTHNKTGKVFLLTSATPLYSVDRGVSQISFSYKVVNDLTTPKPYPVKDIKVRLHLKEV